MTLQINNGNTIEVEHIKHFNNFEEANEVMKKIQQKMAWVNIQHKKVKEKKPEPLNTTKLLQLSSKELGFSVEQTAKYSQKLYEEGFISYPRTESKVYSKNMVKSFDRVLKSI